jgi:hypothetical protein
MSRAHPSTPGSILAEQLLQAIHELQFAPLAGTRDLPLLRGLNRAGGFKQAQENVLANAIELLKESGKVYTYGDSIVMEVDRLDGGGSGLVTLRAGNSVAPGSADFLANIFICGIDELQCPPPKWFTDLLLRAEPLARQLPRIRTYATRSVFNDQFVLCGPGWHPDDGLLVHGPVIEPIPFNPAATSLPAIQRLPPRLRELFAGFCFRCDADLVNAVSVLLTGMTISKFIQSGKPLVIVDGNQPDVGKTWLIRVIGMLLDGGEPQNLFYTADEEELQKRICAKLMEGYRSLLLIDNAKRTAGSAVSSPVIESLSTAAELSLRILGRSENFTRPNDLIFAIAMNDTRVSPDLVSRCVPIQLHYSGQTEDRVFTGPDPIEYAREHRLEILGELAGIIIYWVQRGRADGSRSHRFRQWANVIGGMLETAGFPEFLANSNTAASTFNAGADDLAALAEQVISMRGPIIYIDFTNEMENHHDRGNT